MLSRVKLFSWRGKTWEQPARCPVGPCLPPPLPRVLAGVELPAGGLLLGLWAAKLALCVHSCEPGAGRTVVETIYRLGRPEQGSTALVLVRIQMVPVFAQNLPALSPCCLLSLSAGIRRSAKKPWPPSSSQGPRA